MNETITIGGLTLDFYQDRHTTREQLDLFAMTVAPGARMPVAHYHESWDETVLGLSGTLVFRVDGETVEVAPDTSLFIPRGAVHGFDNLSNAPARCLCMLTPGALGADYFRELAALAAEGPPDPALMKAVMQRYGLVPVADQTPAA